MAIENRKRKIPMTRLHPASVPPLGLGIASMVLGTIGLLLFFLPILGVPISGIGLVLGLAGLLGAAIGFGRGSLRWSVAGVVVCLLALATNLAITYAPGGYFETRPPRELWRSISDAPYVPPPRRPLRGDSAGRRVLSAVSFGRSRSRYRTPGRDSTKTGTRPPASQAMPQGDHHCVIWHNNTRLRKVVPDCSIGY